MLDRLEIAEEALARLAAGKLPHVREFIFNTTFHIRRIQDLDAFEQAAEEKNPDKKLLAASTSAGGVRFSHAAAPHATLYIRDGLTPAEAVLCSKTFAELTAVSYAALGIDMSGRIAMDEMQNAQS